jgi:hypothetical protein
MTMTLPLTSTRDLFGVGDSLAQQFRKRSRTTFNVDIVAREIAEVLEAWDAEDAQIADGLQTLPYPSDPVSAIDFLRGALQVSQDDVLAALDIRERTFFGWKTKGHRPRPESLGRLWPMTQAVYYLSQSHPNLAAWFHTDDRAKISFENGDVDGLVQNELRWALKTYSTPARTAPEFGDGEGRDAEDDEEGAVRSRNRISPTRVDEVSVRVKHRPGDDG